MKQSVIIVAGGKGLRMGSELPKQFIPIGGKPVLMHTLYSFYHYNININIVLVLPLSHQDYWKQLCLDFNFQVPHKIATGGETRFHSVKNGLALIKDGLVAVQDGVRPFASVDMIRRCFDAALHRQAVIPVVKSTDSLRQMVDKENSEIIDRSKVRLVQTPQIFHFEILKKAYDAQFKDVFTDDASVVESIGVDIHLVEGETTNIKITTPLDLKLGELILER